MATFIVTNTNDSGAGSLRQAILDANARDGADVIRFSRNISKRGTATILLSSGQLDITESLTIDGDRNKDGIPDIIVDANQQSRIFNIDDGDSTTNQTTILNGLDITGGSVSRAGGGIRSLENLVVVNSIVTGNSATDNFGTYGGGIYTRYGKLTVRKSTISGNVTSGGGSGGGIFAGDGLEVHNSTIIGNSTLGPRSYGGGIFAAGDIFVNRSTIRDNFTSGYSSFGGGIAAFGDLVVRRSTVANNFTSEALSFGGGIFMLGDLTVSRSTLRNNETSGEFSFGGGIASLEGDLVVRHSTVRRNKTSGDSSGGGGIFSAYGDVTVSNSTISRNKTSGNSSDGGGITQRYGDVTVSDSTISRNETSADNADGGGVSVTSGDLTVSDSTFSDNTTSGDFSLGGAIFSRLGNLTINNSTISGNSTTGDNSSGGGIANLQRYASSSYLATISNSTISGNSAIDYGGGIYNDNAQMRIRNTTITDNMVPTGSRGGGVASNGESDTSTEVVSSIIVGNTNGDVEVILSSETNSFVSQGNNLIGGGTGEGAFTAAGDTIGIIDPGLEPLANNGGPTQTHALKSYSPAINAGSNPDNLEIDQRGPGFDRVVNGQIDIGSFELQTTSDLLLGLYNADDDSLIRYVQDGDVIPGSSLPNEDDLTIVALVPSTSPLAGHVGSVVFNLNGGEVTQTENFVPFALFGDRRGNLKGGNLSGNNSLTLEVYDKKRGRGTLLDTLTIDFTLEPNDATDGPLNTLIDLTGLEGDVAVNASLVREAHFDNTIRFYETDALGTVDDLLPGDRGYEAAIADNLLNGPELMVSDNNSSDDVELILAGGTYYAPVMLIDGDITNLASIGDEVRGHARIQRKGQTWGFEDGTDFDYNDLTLTVNSINELA